MRILLSDGLEKEAIKSLEEKGFEVVNEHYEAEELGEKLKDFDVLVVRSATKVRKPIIDKALEGGRLKLIIRGGVGVDNIDVDYAQNNGITVKNTPRASSISVAELTFGHIISVSRFIHIANVTMREGKWEKKKYEGFELYGKTLGLIGFGRIAQEVAKRAEAFGMKVIYTNLSGKVVDTFKFERCSLEELLRKSDYVSLHIPFDKAKGPVIGKEQLDMMKNTAFLINCARGGVVDEAALLEALNSNKIAGAAIDVFEEEPTKNEALINHPRVSVTPHIGASTIEAQGKIGMEVVNIIEEFAK
ncbi:D-3-phosphoglycerate dehydrogenase [Caloramator quimbayensis]|uniref:2-oxoglutarate reductase n=1 Tax=Caloramator quimbayensis TaxID=1147123 RepID=A0A1T4XQ47_9CLOT|nr:D-2-hydroxyacid dehydrogenase [Caloramator quimbayensis]SKA91672.1 D-3-phosphoglycerate dehydrogenase [Caloramator quimbayensis]